MQNNYKIKIIIFKISMKTKKNQWFNAQNTCGAKSVETEGRQKKKKKRKETMTRWKLGIHQ